MSVFLNIPSGSGAFAILIVQLRRSGLNSLPLRVHNSEISTADQVANSHFPDDTLTTFRIGDLPNEQKTCDDRDAALRVSPAAAGIDFSKFRSRRSSLEIFKETAGQMDNLLL